MAENNVGRMRQVKIAFIEHLLKGIEKILNRPEYFGGSLS